MWGYPPSLVHARDGLHCALADQSAGVQPLLQSVGASILAIPFQRHTGSKRRHLQASNISGMEHKVSAFPTKGSGFMSSSNRSRSQKSNGRSGFQA
jgi:hypothetical protein